MPKVNCDVPSRASHRMRSKGYRRVIAIDAGGSKTKIVLAEGREAHPINILARHEGAAGNIMTRGAQAALQELDAALQHLVGPWDGEPVHAAIIALAGAGDEERRQAVSDWANGQSLAEHIVVLSDAELVLEVAECAAPADGQAMAVIAGTGSIAIAHASDGSVIRAGGWGPLLGDDGGGHWIGRQALRQALREFDLGEGLTEFTKGLCDHVGTDHARGLITHIHTSEHPVTEIAALARYVLEAAESGDTLALDLVHAAAARLESLMRTVRQRSHRDSTEGTVACGGGLLHPQSCLFQFLMSKLADDRLDVLTVEDPAAAAAQLALLLT